jgi:hypothetical protein
MRLTRSKPAPILTRFGSEFRRQSIGHQCVADTIMEAESLPAAARYGDHGLRPGRKVRAQRHLFRRAVWIEAEIVDGASIKTWLSSDVSGWRYELIAARLRA